MCPDKVISPKVDGHEDGLELVDGLEEERLLASEARLVEDRDQRLERPHDSEHLPGCSDRCLDLFDVAWLTR